MSASSTKDPSTAMVIEIMAGYFGFLGIGYLYAGRTAAGLLRLFGWWAFLVVAVLLAIGTTGTLDTEAELEAGLTLLYERLTLAFMGLCCLGLIMLAAPVISGLMLKHSLSAERRGP